MLLRVDLQHACDAPKSGCLVDHRQPTKNLCVSRHETHTCVKWPNRARTSIQHKMYILYKKNVITICFYYKLSKTGSFAQISTKIHNKATCGHFFASKTPDVSHPQVRLRYLK